MVGGREERQSLKIKKSMQEGPGCAGRARPCRKGQAVQGGLSMQEGLSMKKETQHGCRKGCCMQAGWSWAREANMTSFVSINIFPPLVPWHLHSTLIIAHCSEKFSVLADWPVLI